MKQRIFIAFKVSGEAKKELESVQEMLKESNRQAHVSWAKPDSFHVTVLFLGEIEEYKIEETKNILSEIANNFHGFKFWLDRVDAFPNKSSARVLTVRVEEEKRTSIAIHDELVKKLKEIDFDFDDKPWKPHITIGRNKTNNQIQGLDVIEPEKVVWEIDSIELIKSDLEKGGSRYTVLESFGLTD